MRHDVSARCAGLLSCQHMRASDIPHVADEGRSLQRCALCNALRMYSAPVMLVRQGSHAKAQGCARASLLHWKKYDMWVLLAQMRFLGDWEELSPSGIPRWSHQHARTALAPARSLAE